MKIFKNIIFTIVLYCFLLLSIEPMQMYDDSWMIVSYFFHMCILFLYFIIWGITHDKFSDEPYLLGANCTITILLMLLSTYPFFLTSENLSDFIYKYWEFRIEPYEGGIVVTLCIIVSEFILLIFLYEWVKLVKELFRIKKQVKFYFVLGISFPLFLTLGYTTNLYIDYTTKEKEIVQRHKKWEEEKMLRQIKEDSIKVRNDSLNRELAKKSVDLSFGRYQIGVSKNYDNGKPMVYQLLGEEIENVSIKEYNGIIYKIIVNFNPMRHSSSFISKAIELYSKKYGETGTYGIWDFKNGSIEIKEAGTTTKREKESYVQKFYNHVRMAERWVDVEYDIIKIIYINHKVDSIVKKEKTLRKEQQIKEFEEQQKAEKIKTEIEAGIQKQREYEMI